MTCVEPAVSAALATAEPATSHAAAAHAATTHAAAAHATAALAAAAHASSLCYGDASVDGRLFRDRYQHVD